MTAPATRRTRPATDLLIAKLAATITDIRNHNHPPGEDFFCQNLTAWLGERMGAVLQRLADEQAETRRWRDKHTALADEFAAEADRFSAKLAEANDVVLNLLAALNEATGGTR